MRKQIQEMLDRGIIRPSKSEMASPIVLVLKGKTGQDCIRIAIDYRYLNKHCEGDAYPLPVLMMLFSGLEKLTGSGLLI